MEGDVDDVGIEGDPHLIADELDQGVEVELGGHGLADTSDDRKLGRPPVGVMEEFRVLQRDPEARRQGCHQADIGVAERVRSLIGDPDRP